MTQRAQVSHSTTSCAIPSRGILSLSAGGDLSDLSKWRLVTDEGRAIGDLGALFPDLAARGFLTEPVLISAYPGMLGRFSDCVFVDTYLRPANLARALAIAATEGRPAVLVGQPLALAELLLQHLRAKRPLPKQLLLMVGGYACPQGLEEYIRAELNAAKVEHDIIHGYGTAEVAAGCLQGRRGADGVIHYRLAARHVAVEICDGKLFLRRTNGDQPAVDTGDHARSMERDSIEGWQIEPSHARIGPTVRLALSIWRSEDWARRTGYIIQGESEMCIQLRRGVLPQSPDELSYAQFEDRFESSLLEKPRWGTSG